MSDEAAIRILAHRQNIRRYRGLLATPLTELERAFIGRRIAEEESEIRRLAARQYPPGHAPAPASSSRPRHTEVDDHVIG